MNEVTISDIGHAVITLDLELDKLAVEQQSLEMSIEHCKARQAVIGRAIERLLDSGKYCLFGA